MNTPSKTNKDRAISKEVRQMFGNTLVASIYTRVIYKPSARRFEGLDHNPTIGRSRKMAA